MSRSAKFAFYLFQRWNRSQLIVVAPVEALVSTRSRGLLSRPHRLDQTRHADDGNNTHHVVGDNVQRDLSLDARQRLRFEVCRPHPRFDRAERVLDGFAAQRDLRGIVVEALLDAFENRLVLPTTDTSLFSGRTFAFDRASRADVRPVDDGQDRRRG